METKKTQRKVRILSIDGGGIRGIISAVILAELETRLKERTKNPHSTLSDYFDLIAGTSTGGILACFYALPPFSDSNLSSRYPAELAVKLYKERGKDIFKKKILGKANVIFDEKYVSEGIESVLYEYMKDEYISSATTNIMICGYDIDYRKAVFFSNVSAKKNKFKNYRFCDVARATSAAPTYFEVAKIKSERGGYSHIIDAGLFANDPTMCAIVEANKINFKGLNEKKENTKKPGFDDMYIVSLGTGKNKKEYDYEKMKDFGLLRWANPIVEFAMSGSAEIVSFQLKKLFQGLYGLDSKDYIRIDFELPRKNSDMDNVSDENTDKLKDIAYDYIANHSDELNSIVDNLIKYGE